MDNHGVDPDDFLATVHKLDYSIVNPNPKLNEELKNVKVPSARSKALKKVNEMRSAKYQIIKNLSKTKKWTKKAKATLTKLPAEIFYEKFK